LIFSELQRRHYKRSEGSPPPRILWLKTSFFNNYAANL
jgi:hypothetical protein